MNIAGLACVYLGLLPLIALAIIAVVLIAYVSALSLWILQFI